MIVKLFATVNIADKCIAISSWFPYTTKIETSHSLIVPAGFE
jgi:hypothetical protein